MQQLQYYYILFILLLLLLFTWYFPRNPNDSHGMPWLETRQISPWWGHKSATTTTISFEAKPERYALLGESTPHPAGFSRGVEWLSTIEKKTEKNKVVLACFSKENTICDLNQRQLRSVKVLKNWVYRYIVFFTQERRNCSSNKKSMDWKIDVKRQMATKVSDTWLKSLTISSRQEPALFLV